MNYLDRVRLYLERRSRASKYGVRFRGTSLPDNLNRVVIAGQVREIRKPANPGHWYDFINIFLADEYGLGSLDWVPNRIIDLGANIGLFSLYARDCFPEAEIHCYEPNPELFSYLQANLDGLDVEIFRKAVGVESGWCRMDNEVDNRCSRISEGEGIEIDSFDRVLGRFAYEVDLVKIDIEGAEWSILSEVDSRILSRVKRLVIEYHEDPFHSDASLFEAAERLGFSMDHIVRNQGFGIAWMSGPAFQS